jgi:hypothetical protein
MTCRRERVNGALVIQQKVLLYEIRGLNVLNILGTTRTPTKGTQNNSYTNNGNPKLVTIPRIQPFRCSGIVCIYPTVPCPNDLQAVSELTITTTTEFEGWPCQKNPEIYHKEVPEHPGSCRKGYCLYTHQKLALTLQVRESSKYSYSLQVDLNPGFNILSWCRESVLVNGEDYEARFASPTTPSFSLILCCMGMSLTFRPKDPNDIDSPYITSPNYNPMPYKINEHIYPPSLTVLSAAGTVPSLYLLARVAGGEGPTVRKDGGPSG